MGPGDLFKVNIFGQIESEFNFQVLPEGKIVIPTIGEIEVGDLNLSEAKQKITAQIEEFYIKSQISVNLVCNCFNTSRSSYYQPKLSNVFKENQNHKIVRINR